MSTCTQVDNATQTRLNNIKQEVQRNQDPDVTDALQMFLNKHTTGYADVVAKTKETKAF